MFTKNVFSDPPEVLKMDEETVKKIQEARSLFQLQKHEKEELNTADTFVCDIIFAFLSLANQMFLYIYFH